MTPVVTYEAHCTGKEAEEDVFNEGCIPDSMSFGDVYLDFTAPTLEGLLAEIQDFLWVTDSEDLHYDDRPGRLIVQRYEDVEGNKALKEDFEKWEKGQKRLWLACYFFHVERVTREPAVLELETA